MNVQSLEAVIEFLLDLSEKRVSEVRDKVEEKSVAELVDLEAEKTPEMVMLSSTTSENASDRTQRCVPTQPPTPHLLDPWAHPTTNMPPPPIPFTL